MAWKKGMNLVRLVYEVTSNFPKIEAFGLTSQMRRAAVSIPSNIAEGQARHSKREFTHFLRNTRGSLAELETQALLASDLGYLTEEQATKLLRLADELSRILSGLISSLREE
ncbi:MAG: four helix bundle protein [Terriglobales bacterium]